MAVEVPQNEEICGGGNNGGRKGIGFAIRRGRANRGAYTLRMKARRSCLWRC